MNNPKQLIFPWSTKNKASFEHYYFEDINLSLKDALLKQDDLFIYGISGTGKSFLLQSICNHISLAKKLSLYVPLNDVIKHGPEFLDSLEELDLICIDEIDLIAGNKEWEIAIFNLINNCLISKCRLIFSSQLNPSTIEFNLIDLFSRIKKINHIKILHINNTKHENAIMFITKTKSLNLGDNEINYLMTHSKRNISNLVEILEKLDKLSLQLKRKITIPLIKEVI